MDQSTAIIKALKASGQNGNITMMVVLNKTNKPLTDSFEIAPATLWRQLFPNGSLMYRVNMSTNLAWNEFNPPVLTMN